MKNETENKYPALTAYRVTTADGKSFTTSMAWNVTLTMANDYYHGRKIGGSTIGHIVTKVEKV